MLPASENNSLLNAALQIRVELAMNATSDEIARLLYSANNGCIEVLRSHSGYAIGYIAWASVVRETMEQFIVHDEMPRYFYEWNEGGICFIHDVVLSKKWSNVAKRELLKFVKRKRVLCFKRRGKVSVYIRKQNMLRRVKSI